jgi:uncharacterized protein YjdB
MIKKLLSLILAFMLVLSVVPLGTEALASDAKSTLSTLVRQFPHGKYWNHVGKSNNPDGVTSTACASHSRCHWGVNRCNCNSFDNAIQCMGYAHKISYEITGVYPRNNYQKIRTLKASDLRVGDIIRYRWDGHSICVTGVNGNKISFTDCNYIGRCQIRWGVMNLSDIIGFTYVLRLKGNNRKNSDIYFYQNKTPVESAPEINLESNHEVWEMQDSTLNLRSTYRTDANIVGKIPAGARFDIYDKYFDGTYMWGKVAYGDMMGWCALNYSKYIEGYIEKPAFTNTNEAYVAKNTITLSWNEVMGTTEYIIYLYGSNGALMNEYRVNSEKFQKNIKLNKVGQYSVEIVAVSDVTPSWQMRSGIYSFNIINPVDVVYVKSLKFTAPTKMVKGESITLDAEVTPTWASDCGITWKTSDKKIASVNKQGKVTAKKYGEVTITATAADRGKVSYKKQITVVPETPEDISQTGATTSSVSFKWTKVNDAKFYAVYKYNNETQKYDKIDTCKENSYTMKASAGKTYKVKVHAVAKSDSGNCYSEASEILSVVSCPEAPTLKVSSGYKKAVLSWSESKGATHYVIYQVKDGKNVNIATVSSSDNECKYTVSNLKSGTYTFKVRAVRKADTLKGYGNYSTEVKVKV